MKPDRLKEIRRIAVIDVGKTNAKVVLVDAGTGEESGLSTAPTIVRRDGPYPHFDVARDLGFPLRCAGRAMRRASRIDAIATIAHGSAGAFHLRRGGRRRAGAADPRL